MRFTENLLIARIVLVVAIAVSLIFGGGGALMDRRVSVEAAFNASSESIAAELSEMRSNATVLAAIAGKYDTANPDHVSALNGAVSALDAAEDPAAKYDASLSLDTAVENLYSHLTGLKLGDMDAQDARYAYKNFTSAQLRITHDGYNQLAAEFNADFNKFPAKLLGMLRGADELGLFQ